MLENIKFECYERDITMLIFSPIQKPSNWILFLIKKHKKRAT